MNDRKLSIRVRSIMNLFDNGFLDYNTAKERINEAFNERIEAIEIPKPKYTIIISLNGVIVCLVTDKLHPEVRDEIKAMTTVRDVFDSNHVPDNVDFDFSDGRDCDWYYTHEQLTQIANEIAQWENEPITDGLGREYNAEGLRYVSPEVGYVDQDEEYY